jgi:hypothetical protein
MDQPPTPPPFAVLQLILNVWTAKAAAAFARLGFADLIGDGAQDANDLAKRAGTNADATYRLLRALAAAGILEARPDGRFALTPVGQCLRTGAPGSMRSLLIAELAPGHWLPWGDLEHSIRTGGPATLKTLGKPVWEYYSEHAAEGEAFADGMSNISSMVIQAVLAAYSFAGARLVVDVGGSHGSLLSAVLRAVPGARGILFDLPQAVSGAGPSLAREGVADRVECRGGSFFEAVPTGGDIYLLKTVLHDWNDEECVKILTACRAAMDPDGRVVVVEMIIDSEGPPSPAPFMDLNMLVMLTGRERTREEFSALFEHAGLALARIVPTQSPFVVIEARRR